jgi:hypothetical protein
MFRSQYTRVFNSGDLAAGGKKKQKQKTKNTGNTKKPYKTGRLHPLLSNVVQNWCFMSDGGAVGLEPVCVSPGVCVEFFLPSATASCRFCGSSELQTGEDSVESVSIFVLFCVAPSAATDSIPFRKPCVDNFLYPPEPSLFDCSRAQGAKDINKR